MAFKLTIAKGYEQGREIVVRGDEATIGRTTDNDVVLTEIGVSKRHVRLFTRGGKVHAEDPGKHRTLLNDQPLTEARELAAGDLIALGPVVLRFEPLHPHRDAPPIDRVTTRVAPPEVGEAPDLHKLPTAPMGGGKAMREVVPIHRAPTAPLPLPGAEHAIDRTPTAPVSAPPDGGRAIDREPTDPERSSPEVGADGASPVLPPLPASLIARLKSPDGELRSGPPASRSLTPKDTPAFSTYAADAAAHDTFPPEPRAANPGPASGARLGDAGPARSSGQKSKLRPELAALPVPAPPKSDPARSSGQKPMLNAPGTPRASGAKSAVPNVLDASIRPATFPEDDRPTEARVGPYRAPRRPVDQRTVAAAAATLAAVVLFVFAVRWIVRGDAPDLGPDSLDSDPITESFGAGPGVSHPVPDVKAFDLDARPEPRVVALLHLSAANLSAGELDLQLNGSPLPHRVGATGSEQPEVEVVLPREALRPDGNNRVEFRRVAAAGADPMWRISHLWVERVALPESADAALVDSALKFASRGREYLDRSASAPDSLFHAWRAYRSAWLTVEPVRPPHALYDEARAKYEAIGRTLDERCLALVAAAERSLQGRDAKGARDSLDQVSRYFPSGEHRCHNLAVELLSQHGL